MAVALALSLSLLAVLDQLAVAVVPLLGVATVAVILLEAAAILRSNIAVLSKIVPGDGNAGVARATIDWATLPALPVAVAYPVPLAPASGAGAAVCAGTGSSSAAALALGTVLLPPLLPGGVLDFGAGL